jgi:hypothetical protein
MNKKKYEYQWYTVEPGVNTIEELNNLGADGWRVRSVFHGALHDDVSYAKILLERETNNE